MFEKYKAYFNYRKQIKMAQAASGPNRKQGYGHGQEALSAYLNQNRSLLQQLLHDSDDVVFRDFCFGTDQQFPAFICFIDGLEDKKLIDNFIIRALSFNLPVFEKIKGNFDSEDFFQKIKYKVLEAVELKEATRIDDALEAILAGNTLLCINGYNQALIISAKGGKTRNVEENQTEVEIRGPRDGFNEVLRVNTSLLRRRLKNPNLVFESFRLGEQTHTDVEIAYLQGVANAQIIEEVRRRINRIDIDSVLGSGYIEQMIEDHPLSPFSTIRNTERPDKVAAKLMEGRVAIFCDGTPFVLTVPHVFVENFQVPEDYYSRFMLGSFLRLLRYCAYIMTLVLPALYVAMETYNQDMIPTTLLITAASARETTPFPAFLETTIMILVFEMLRESGERLPRQIGQAVSIVGALVIGEAAVRAGIVSAPLIIITGITGITSFMVPSLLDSIIIFRFFLLLWGGSFGMLGICIGSLLIIGYMCSLHSFGVPYMAPLAPREDSDMKDAIIRLPLWLMNFRPRLLRPQNSRRQQTGDSTSAKGGNTP